jgi:hypothetical protein
MNIQSNLTQKKIEIVPLIKESWELVNGLKKPIFYIFLIYMALFIPFFILTAILSLIFLSSALENPLLNPAFIIAFSLFFILMSYVLSTAIMLGVRQAIGLPAQLKMALADCMKPKKNLFYLFIFNLIIIGIFEFVRSFILPDPDSIVGIGLLIITYLILIYCTLPLYAFALPLIVTKRADTASAIESGFRMMKRYWLEVMVSYIIITIIAFISMIPLGIGIIWTGPMYFAWTGILFRNAYGLKKK